MSDLSAGYSAILEAFMEGVKPDPDMPIDEWADEFMYIPKDSGANEYGKYRTDRTPHARKVMQALSPSHPAKRVVCMVASQMFKTQVALNFLCATIHQQPANVLWLMPTGKLAKRIGKRIDKTLAAVPALEGRVADARSRDAANNQDTKDFQGGTLYIATAGSAANLAEVPARYLIYDEIDRSESNVDKEGSPASMAEARQTTFEHNRKSYFPSSPTIDGESTIQGLFQQGTRHEALAECVHCGTLQPLVFEKLQMMDAGEAAYPCQSCGLLHFEADKPRMFARGEWSEGVPGDGETVSFSASQMFLPYGWTSWTSLMKLYAAAAEKLAEGSDELMIAFYNTRLARVWKRDAERTKAQDLRDRVESYKLGTVPAPACVVTGAVDTQNDRLEFKAMAWGEGMESWVVDYQVIHGSPDEDATWQALDKLLQQRYRHQQGQMLPISAVFVDSGGSATQEVYDFTRTRRNRHIHPIKGHSRPNRPILPGKPSLVDLNIRGRLERLGVKLWLIGVDTAKDWLLPRWSKKSGPGAIHFSEDLPRKKNETDPPDYFDQLTSEFKTGGYKRGHRVTWWEKKPGDRNEALDLAVYNLACAHYLGLHKRTAAQWQTLRDSLNPNTGDLFDMPNRDEEPAPTSQSDSAPSSPPPVPIPRRSEPNEDIFAPIEL